MKNKKLTLAIDLNVIINNNTPNNDGLIRSDAAQYIAKLYQDGHYIIITSGLSSDQNASFKSLLTKLNVPFDLFNANRSGIVKWFKEDPRKIVADIYIDSDSLTYIPLDWEDIYQIVQEKWKR